MKEIFVLSIYNSLGKKRFICEDGSLTMTVRDAQKFDSYPKAIEGGKGIIDYFQVEKFFDNN
jgi:hypothetical protein